MLRTRFISSSTVSSTTIINNSAKFQQAVRYAAAKSTTSTGGVGSSKANAASAKVDPKALPPPTMKEKIKKELWTVLKLNLVLVPVLVIGSMFMYPPQDPKKEKEMMDLYKKSAGWKT